ncbi:glycoside hydrolase family 32 protein [Microlunatus parietis]|uniref:beta-fructofuranosidase n=1 Tax=Microlunatus parietis TaxID=682979 RepID=A0A7Y9I8T7_9ACTN|nr:glycoside hydrolase family 32 protein [Microlunatus parietis]NYE72205.1 beta-fructofuranosidase [Microlunatus parietis]
MTDPFFPRLHPRPDRGWINDPNGLARIDDRWHVFFQWNPDSTRHERIHWGHASSADLLHWRVEPAALRPRPGRPDAYGCYTGCLVDDDGTPTAVYSAVTDRSGRSDVLLARAEATARNWRQDELPVLPMPDDPRFSDIRDPFLFEFDDHRWAIIGAGRPGGDPAVLAYRVDKLTDWIPAGTLLDHTDPVAAEVAPADIWECPNLIRVDGHWVLIISLWRAVSHPGQRELAGVRALLGDLDRDGDQLRFRPRTGGPVDTGPAFYAPQVLATQERALLWGWSWELRDADESVTAGWAGSLTHPRELAVRDGRLVSRPARELEALIGAELTGPTTPAFLVRFAGPGTLDADGAAVITVAGPAEVWVDGSVVEAYPESGTPFTTRGYPRNGWSVTGAAEVYELRLPGDRTE